MNTDHGINPNLAKAKSAGLWNLYVPLDTDPEVKWGAGLTNLEYAFMAEEMGHCLFGSEPFNCSPPDTGKTKSLMTVEVLVLLSFLFDQILPFCKKSNLNKTKLISGSF